MIAYRQVLDIGQSSDILWCMAAKTPNTLERKLKAAIRGSELTRYAISQATGIEQSALSRFMSGERSLSLDAASKLLDLFDLKIVPKGKSKGR